MISLGLLAVTCHLGHNPWYQQGHWHHGTGSDMSSRWKSMSSKWWTTTCH